MPVKYIGRVTHFKGKTLFDILCRLKNFGVGRMVYRNQFHERYPEPSYYIITKVDPYMKGDPTLRTESDDYAKSLAYGMRVFRGEPCGNQVIKSGYKTDWRLIHRDEEKQWSEAVNKQPRALNIVPDTLPLPPLLRHMMLNKLVEEGKGAEQLPVLNTNFQRHAAAHAVKESEAKYLDEVAN